MPSDKKRINLTIPDEIYERLQTYKDENGVVSDATACLQLIVQQLKAQEDNKVIMQFLQNTSLEQLQQVTSVGTKLMYQAKAEQEQLKQK